MNKRLRLSVAVMMWFVAGQWAWATNSSQELDQVMKDLLAWLPGEYSTGSQLDMEERLGTSPDGKHEERFRIFAEVSAPHIGDNVIYGQLHAGGPDGPIIPGTQILYIVEKDEAHQVVKANGRRLARGEDFVDAHLYPKMQNEFELDPNTGGNCDFRWRRHGNQIVGILANIEETYADGNCTMVSKVSGLQMTWDAEWMLNSEELWIYDNGYLEDGSLFIGREDRTHQRLKRVRWFSCSVGTGESSTHHRIHDGGGVAALKDGKKIRLIRSWWPVDGGGIVERRAIQLGTAENPSASFEKFVHAEATAFKSPSPEGAITCELID